MTTSKSNKTLIGLPSDLQAVLQQVNAQEQEREQERQRAGTQQAGAQAPLQHDLSRTQYGNPHADGAGPRHHSPPPLPNLQNFQAPPGYAAPPLPNQSPSARPPGSLQRTLIGMVPAEPPTHQAGWGADAAAQQQATAHAVVSQALSNLPSLGRHEPSVVVSGFEAGHGAGAFDPSRTSALPPADATRGEGFGLSLSSTGALHSAEASAPAPLVGERPRLSLSREQTTTTPVRASRRVVPWALAGAALAVITGVAVWRLPRLLESLRAPNAAEAANVPRAAAADTAPAAPSPVTTALSAATDPVPAVVEQDIPKAERGPVPPAVDGATAELERQAIELLIAKDYPAAARVYERLRVAEPSHREYSVMIDVLARPACGQPGQAACAAQ